MPGMIDEQVEGAEPQEAAEPAEGGSGIGNRTKSADAIPKELRGEYERLVLAAAKILYSEEAKDMVQQQMARQVPLPQMIGEGAAGLMAMVLKQAKGRISAPSVIAATLEVAAEVADFVSEASSGEMAVDEEVRRQAMQFAAATVMQGIGMDKGAVQGALMGQSQQAPQAQPAGAQPPEA